MPVTEHEHVEGPPSGIARLPNRESGVANRLGVHASGLSRLAGARAYLADSGEEIKVGAVGQ